MTGIVDIVEHLRGRYERRHGNDAVSLNPEERAVFDWLLGEMRSNPVTTVSYAGSGVVGRLTSGDQVLLGGQDALPEGSTLPAGAMPVRRPREV